MLQARTSRPTDSSPRCYSILQTTLQIMRLPVFEVIERYYPALRILAESDCLAPGLFQAGIDSGDVEVAVTRAGINPGPKPAVQLL
jgi:hypothetical protein